MPDGTLMQWGAVNLSGSGPYYSFTFGQSFVGSPQVLLTTETSSVIFRVPATTETGATAMVISGEVPSTGSNVKWIAIGRWK